METAAQPAVVVDRAAFLREAVVAAARASHVWPGAAAAEAALDSNFGTTEIAQKANNYFNLRAPAKLNLADRVYTTRSALRSVDWLAFSSMRECFEFRMLYLRRFTMFYLALRAKTAEIYVHEVSKLWSVDPKREAAVLDLLRVMEGKS